MKLLKNFLLLTVSTVVALLCAEVTAQLAGYKAFSYANRSPWQPALLAGDSELGWRNKTGRHEHSFLPDNGYPVTTTISADGARVSAGTNLRVTTIELYGGSIGFGWGVTDGTTVGDILAQRTGNRVVNRAVGGYGGLQVLMRMQRAARTWSPSSKPAAIVYLQATHHMNRSSGEPEWLFSNERNNPRGGMMKGIPYARFDRQNNLVIQTAERYPAFPLRERFALVNIAEQAWVRFDRAISNAGMLSVQAELVRRMAALADSNGVPFFVIAVYSQPADFTALREKVGKSTANWEFCMHPGFPVKKFTVPNDGHPNAIVHQHYGECVARSLSATLANRLGN